MTFSVLTSRKCPLPGTLSHTFCQALRAANTLGKVGQESQQPLWASTEAVDKLRTELTAVRHEHFLARKHRTKRELRKKDKIIRHKLAQLLGGGKNTSQSDTQQLADFNPYDQNTSAEFFDPKWMFNLDSGKVGDSNSGKFDIVIGNPPYGAKIDRKRLESMYALQDQWDSYLVFLERAFELCKPNGIIEFIIPNTWLINLKQRKMRRHVFSKKTVTNIKFYNKKIFDAVVDTYNFSIINTPPSEISRTKLIKHEDENQFDTWYSEQFAYKVDLGEPINIFAKPEERRLAMHIGKQGGTLDNLCFVAAGIKPYEVGKGKPPQTAEMKNQRVYDSRIKIDESYLPLLRGGDFHRYTLSIAERWIKYG